MNGPGVQNQRKTPLSENFKGIFYWCNEMTRVCMSAFQFHIANSEMICFLLVYKALMSVKIINRAIAFISVA